MSDILDVLNIKSYPQQKDKESKQQQQPQQNIAELRQIYAPEEYASNAKRRKLSAMNRELYNLIGSNVPPLAIDTASVSNAGGGKKFKEKLLNNKVNAPWRRLGFKNSARNDDLVLYHWTKAVPTVKSDTSISEKVEEKVEGTEKGIETAEGKQENQSEVEQDVEMKDATSTLKEVEMDPNEYRYAKYNTKLQIPTFTEEEYEEAMKVEEAKRETELTVKLAKEKQKLEKEKEKEKKKQSSEPVSDTKEKEKTNEPDVKTDVTKKNSTEPKKENIEETSKTPSTEEVTETANPKSEKPNPEGEKTATSVENEEKEENNEKSTEKEQNVKIDEKEEEKEEKDSDEKREKQRAWSYEETKFLFDLCSEFDMRWAVIFDRYQDKYSDRTLEDLKVQMYSISAYLLEKKGNLNDSALIKALRSFKKDKELERKYYLTKLIHRAPTEIAEEESLVIEARKFELSAKKMLLERAQLLQLLDSPQSSASVQQYLTSQGLTQLYNSLMASDKNKKRKVEIPVAPLLGPNAIPHTQHIQMSSSNNNNSSGNNATPNSNSGNVNNGNNAKRRSNGSGGSNPNTNSNAKVASGVSNSNVNNNKPVSKLSEVQQLLQKNLTAEELEVYGIEIHSERIQPGVHVRSQKIASFKPSVQAKVHEILGQLGLSVKPTMPTGPVSKQFDELLYKISRLVDLKKQSDKLLAEINLIKRQKGLI